MFRQNNMYAHKHIFRTHAFIWQKHLTKTKQIYKHIWIHIYIYICIFIIMFFYIKTYMFDKYWGLCKTWACIFINTILWLFIACCMICFAYQFDILLWFIIRPTYFMKNKIQHKRFRNMFMRVHVVLSKHSWRSMFFSRTTVSI